MAISTEGQNNKCGFRESIDSKNQVPVMRLIRQ